MIIYRKLNVQYNQFNQSTSTERALHSIPPSPRDKVGDLIRRPGLGIHLSANKYYQTRQRREITLHVLVKKKHDRHLFCHESPSPSQFLHHIIAFHFSPLSDKRGIYKPEFEMAISEFGKQTHR